MGEPRSHVSHRAGQLRRRQLPRHLRSRPHPGGRAIAPRRVMATVKAKRTAAVSKTRPTISACLIVRDEARLLPRCLRSIAGAYDELCIVDTGSSDNTLEIARKAGARTLQFTACNDAEGKIEDFAAPRNAALQLATGDWILQIDAD